MIASVRNDRIQFATMRPPGSPFSTLERRVLLVAPPEVVTLAATGDVAEAVEVTVYFKADVPLAKAEQLAASARERRDVAAVKLTTADDALAEFREFSGFGAALEALAVTAGSAKTIPSPVAPAETSLATRVASQSHGRIFLLRGLLNVFSLGMDTLARKIRAKGMPAEVTNFTNWRFPCQNNVTWFWNGSSAPFKICVF